MNILNSISTSVASAFVEPTIKNKSHPKFAGSGPGDVIKCRISEINVVEGKRKTKVVPMSGSERKHLINVRNTCRKKSEITPTAKSTMVYDLQTKLANERVAAMKEQRTPQSKTSIVKSVAKHYKVSERSVWDAERRVKRGRSLVSKHRCGRTSKIDKKFSRLLDETWESLNGALQTIEGVHNALLQKQKDGITGFEWVPSIGTLHTYFYKNPDVKLRTLCKRPRLSEVNIQKRKEICERRLKENSVDSFDTDEAQLEVHPKNWRFVLHAGQDARKKMQEVMEKRDNKTKKAYNQAAVKIFLSMVVTRPSLLNEAEFKNGAAPVIDPKKNGKVLLVWLREQTKRKRGVGEDLYNDITLNGERFLQLHWADGGICDSIEAYTMNTGYVRDNVLRNARLFCYDGDDPGYDVYAAPSRKRIFRLDDGITLQQDNAGGHSTKSDGFAKLIELYEDAGITMELQPPASPETNMCDLGVWSMLKTAITKRCSEIADKGTQPEKYIQQQMWEIAKEEWDKIDPLNLLIISEHKKRIFERIVKLEGKSVQFEPHNQTRKKIKGMKQADC